MSTRVRLLALAVALAAFAPLGASAGDKPQAQQKGVLTKDVDFSKPPHLVEAYNKARIKAKAVRDPKTQALTIEVTGKAYYPDGVTFSVDARYWKHKTPFFSTNKAMVKDRAFTVKLGPFSHAVPAGVISVEAWFIAADQSPEVRDKLTKGNYFHCSPPCHYDRKNVTRDRVYVGASDDTGADAAQLKDEDLEKTQLAKARQALLDAGTVAGKTFDAVRKKQRSVSEAETALAQLEDDRKAALEAFAKWKATRQFLLFPEKEQEIERLASCVRDAGRANAAAAGVKVPGVEASAAPGAAERATLELSKLADELKAFIDEKGSLDAAWDNLKKAAEQRNGVVPSSSKAGGR